MSVYRRGSTYYYYFRVRRPNGKGPSIRVRKAVPLARTKWQAEQAELKEKKKYFEGQHGMKAASQSLVKYVHETYLPWAKVNKRSWKHDESRSQPLCEFFKDKDLDEITSSLVEKYKEQRLKSVTRKGGLRSPASVNRELQLLSKILSNAVKDGLAEKNPCLQVQKLREDNKRYRYLKPDEEPRLMEALIGPRAHLKPLVIVAIGTGLRRGEQLRLRWSQVDFTRNIVTAMKTKSNKDRDVPMHEEVAAALRELRAQSHGDGYVFINPKTRTRYKDLKRAFKSALRIAGIKGLVWHDLRATFGTRLGEAGYSAYTIADLMGHSDIRTTQRYVRATEGNKRAAVEAARLSSQKIVHKLSPSELRSPQQATVNV